MGDSSATVTGGCLGGKTLHTVYSASLQTVIVFQIGKLVSFPLNLDKAFLSIQQIAILLFVMTLRYSTICLWNLIVGEVYSSSIVDGSEYPDLKMLSMSLVFVHQIYSDSFEYMTSMNLVHLSHFQKNAFVLLELEDQCLIVH